MIQNSEVPFNIKILELTPKKLYGLKPVRSNDIFDGATGNLNEDGLFSISIFGKPGDERRSVRFSYVDIKLPVFHPIIYFALTDLKKLYGLIMESKEYAIWNDEIKDFEKSNPIEGETGFHFFLTHWRDIIFKPSKSDARIDQIKLIDKYKDIALTDKIVIIPAGLRDIEISDDGRTKKDEINDIYSSFISVSRAISDIAIKSDIEYLNPARVRLQNNFNNLYLMLEGMIKGKHKLFLSKWASRRIQNGTRNVITALKMDNTDLDKSGNISFNNTVIGLYQMMKAAAPITRFEFSNSFISEIFVSPELPVRLVDTKTLKSVKERLSSSLFDRWSTNEGVDKLITGYAENSIRHQPVMVGDKYLALIYKGEDKTFKVFRDIDELPEGFSKDLVSPITWTELFYITTQKKLNGLPSFVTRYPITGIGSIYPSLSYVKTTVIGEERIPLDENWEEMGSEHTLHQFPIRNLSFVNAISPNSSRLSRLGADFDGDTCSFNVVVSDEAVSEVNNFLNSKKAYVDTDGKFLASVGTDNVQLVLRNLTFPD